MIKKYNNTFIGLIFTVAGILLTFTFFVPILVVGLTGAVFETIFKTILGDVPFETIGISIIITFLILFIGTGFLYYRLLIKQLKKNHKAEKSQFIIYLFSQVIIIPTLVMYLITATNWQIAHDGQYAFVTIAALPIGSIPLVFLGLIVDLIQINLLKNIPPNTI
jgi:hypothetical protein